MAVTGLTSAQQQSVDELLRARRIDRVPQDARRAAAFLASASDRLGQLPLLTSVAVKYDIAYDAAHDVGEALLAAYGYRTTNGPCHHEALGRFLRAVLDDPPADESARRFDQLRRARDQSRYAAMPASAGDAALAEKVARSLHRAARARQVGGETSHEDGSDP